MSDPQSSNVDSETENSKASNTQASVADGQPIRSGQKLQRSTKSFPIGIVVIVAALVIWCGLIAWGTLFPSVRVEGVETDYRKPLFVVGTIGAFLLVWIVLLAGQRKR